jgi:uncharacterized membrane protein
MKTIIAYTMFFLAVLVLLSPIVAAILADIYEEKK